MELRIDIGKPGEIAQGLILLQSLAVAHRAHQAEVLKPKPEAVPPPAPPAPTPAAEPVGLVTAEIDISTDAGVTAAICHVASQETHSNEGSEDSPDAPQTGDAPAVRRAGRKPDSPEVKAQKEAARLAAKAAAKEANQAAKVGKPAALRDAATKPVGQVLKGVPAHDLAAALNEPAAAQDAAPEPAPEPIKANGHDTSHGGVTGDSDLAQMMAKPVAPVVAAPEPAPEPTPAPAATFSDADLFPEPAPVPAPAPAPEAEPSEFDTMNLAQLEVAWRAEGIHRGVHWLRAAVERHSIRNSKDLTVEMLREVMKNPDAYMPPAVA